MPSAHIGDPAEIDFPMDNPRAETENSVGGARRRSLAGAAPSISTGADEGRFSMAYLITDACNKCGTCKEACPVEAIQEGEPIYAINQDECTECGACVSECPNDAIQEK
jgi:ferredoxin